jgi:glycerol kinase
VDGGLSRSDWIMQRLADLAEVPVRRAGRADSTGLGAAALAGLAAGVWDEPGSLPPIAAGTLAEPRPAGGARERWAAARAAVTSGP